jgi:hypothetical protein
MHRWMGMAALVLSIWLIAFGTARAQGAGTSLFLPAVNDNYATTSPGDPDPDPDPDPGPDPVRSDFFVDQASRTSSADVAVDANGGIHVAGYYYQTFNTGQTAAFYRYCASGCDNAANWKQVNLLDLVNEVQVEVTPAGKPRLLIRTSRDQAEGPEFYYAECNANCTNAAGWKTVEVQKGGATSSWQIQDDWQPQRSFALDPQGRPRFLYIDRTYWIEPDRLGTYYKYCDANCINAANWSEVLVGRVESGLVYEMFEYPTLVFTSQGQPRILAAYAANGQTEALLHYLQCNAGCEDVDNWDRVDLWPRGQGPKPSWDLALDSQDRPRLVFYPEYMDDDSGQRLYYGVCNQNCTNANSWQRAVIGLETDYGKSPDLVFGPNGLPRLAYVSHGGAALGFAECIADCNAADATWTPILLDSNVELENDWPVPIAPICDDGLWNFWTPSLAFDAKGNIRIVVDATYHGYCWWDTNYNEWKESYQFWLIQRSVRGVFVDWP